MKKYAIWIALFLTGYRSTAQDSTARLSSLEILGFVMTDAGYNFNQVNPDWYDAMRPSKLPTYENEFGTNGNTYFGHYRRLPNGVICNWEVS